MDMLEQFLPTFLAESGEALDEMENDLLEMEDWTSDPEAFDREVVDRVFRAMHTMKGNAGFLGFDQVVAVTHSAESLLDRVRTKEIELTAAHVSVLCEALDFCQSSLQHIREHNADGELADTAATVRGLLEPFLGAGEAAEEDGPDEPAEAEAEADDIDGFEIFGSDADEYAAPQQVEGLEIFDEDEPAAPEQVEGLEIFDEDEPAAPQPVEGLELFDEDEPAPAAAAVQPEPEPEPEAAPAPAPEPPKAKKADKAARKAGAAGGASIRVELRKLDSLMNLVGELIVAENMVSRNPDLRGYEFENFNKATLQLERIIRELQDVTMSVRMVPIKSTLQKQRRLVRDLALKLDKKVQLNLIGEDTEVDKTVAELIGDPLVHIIRNSLDHGLEGPEERLAAGKPGTGTIQIEAKHEGGEVWIVVRDDGRGMNRQKILSRAIERGLVDDASALPDAQVFGMVFEPGFSTAEAVTAVSGRGVGMDVVKRNIQQLGGRIDIASKAGLGTEIRLRIPLTLAIIEGLDVSVGPQMYTASMSSVLETVELDEAALVYTPDDQELYRYRGDFIPVIRLAERHRIQADAPQTTVLLILEEQGRRFGLHVHRLLGKRQTVIKPLPPYMGELDGLAGCSITSSGDVSLVLDIRRLVALESRQAA